jgi:hypothetical protein
MAEIAQLASFKNPTGCPNMQNPPDTSTNNHHETTHICTRIAHPHLQDLEKHLHPTAEIKGPKTYHPRLAKRRLMTHNIDPTREGTREDEQTEEDRLEGKESY